MSVYIGEVMIRLPTVSVASLLGITGVGLP